MKRILPIILLLAGITLFGLAFMFYQKSESLKSETDALRELTMPQSYEDESPAYEPEPEPEYDPTDLDQTPPGVTPFHSTTVCLGHWGNHLRQYCDGGDNAALELIEGGDDQAETMRVLTMCMNELLHRMDAYKTDFRPMDSQVALNEANRKSLACKLTGAYGDSPVFNDGSVYYMAKEHMEVSNIKRLEDRKK